MTHSDTKKQYWSKHIEGWETSYLNQKEYCKKQGISYAAFGYWRSHLLKESQQSHKKAASTPTFKQAIITSTTTSKSQSAASTFKIVLPSQIKIEIPTTISQIELTSVFHALGVLL